MAPHWPEVLLTVIFDGHVRTHGITVLVNAKLAGVATPVTVAATLYGPPAVALAVKTGDIAIPLASVVAVAVSDAPGKVPLAPAPGAVNVTVAPGIGTAPAPVTVACKGAAKAVFTLAD
jgi:hypothetical protein